MVFVSHTIISYIICGSMSKTRDGKGIVSSTYIHEFYRGKTWHKRKDFILLGCVTYFTLLQCSSNNIR